MRPTTRPASASEPGGDGRERSERGAAGSMVGGLIGLALYTFAQVIG